ncbi:hypothetical protein CDIK_3104 [Cucumispora dikerogammari]|nr:hypothetical protein CDIK_3104 [Cucumispora dikerogammari]
MIESQELVKCTENIKGSCYKDFVIDSSFNYLILTPARVHNNSVKGSCIASYKLYKTYKRTFPLANQNGAKDLVKNDVFFDKFNKSTNMNLFRKHLGISADEINTSMFKFSFVFKANDTFYSHRFKSITFETEQFRFRLNEDGNLVINKPIKPKRCVKGLGLNQ